jgi:hypothetical protein
MVKLVADKAKTIADELLNRQGSDRRYRVEQRHAASKAHTRHGI